MTNDAKEWKTVKIEAPVRDDAQADPRTYSEIMRAGLHTRQDGPTADDAQEALGLPNAAFPDDFTLEFNDDLAGGVPDDLADQLDRIESAAKEATNAAQNAERAAEELAGQR